jgi:glycosyltransferase involved in cell wall biosynthesis
LKIYIQQPVVPEYRVPLFSALNKVPGIDIEVHASQRIEGLPATANVEFDFPFTAHDCRLKFKGTFYQQKEMCLPDHYGSGDILVYNSNPRFISNMSLVKQARKKGCRVIAWNHANSSTSKGLRSWLRKKMTSGAADNLLLYTEGEVEAMVSEGWSRSSLYYLNNTIDESKIVSVVKEYCGDPQIDIIKARRSNIVQQFKEKQNFTGKINLLYCGRLTEKSKLDILIRSIAALSHEEQAKIHVNVIGDGSIKEEYMKLAEELLVQQNFNWLGAIYDEIQLAPWFLSADYFMYPGAIGLSLNHSMAYALPVITHGDKKNQMPEFFFLEDGYNGLLYEAGNVESLKKLLVSLSTAESHELSSNAYKTMHEKYSFANMVENFAKCLLEG